MHYYCDENMKSEKTNIFLFVFPYLLQSFFLTLAVQRILPGKLWLLWLQEISWRDWQEKAYQLKLSCRTLFYDQIKFKENTNFVTGINLEEFLKVLGNRSSRNIFVSSYILKALPNEDTLLLMMFLGRANARDTK